MRYQKAQTEEAMLRNKICNIDRAVRRKVNLEMNGLRIIKTLDEDRKVERRFRLDICKKKKELLDEWQGDKFGVPLPDEVLNLITSWSDRREYQSQQRWMKRH